MSRGVCSIDGCDRPHSSRGWCALHYRRWRTNGDPMLVRKAPGPKPRPIAERLEEYIHRTESCWLWTGTVGSGGYGHMGIGQKLVLAHRLAYEFYVGPIPEGLTIDHLCRVRHCVNPEHLEPVTMRENVMRSTAPTAINARKTHCKYGHEFTPENTFVHPVRGDRSCRACGRARYHAAKEAAHG